MPLSYDDAAAFAGLESVEKPKKKITGSNTNIDSFLEAEGATHLKPVVEAIYGQESGGGRTHATSIDGARGQMQVMPATFKRLAKEGENVDNPDDNMRVGIRYIKMLGDKFGNDPARIAAGYFSGEGNVNPAGDTPYKFDRADGNKKTVSSYVKDVMGRIGNTVIPSAQAAEVDGRKLAQEIAASGDTGVDLAREIAGAGMPSTPAAEAKQTPAEASLLDKAKKFVGWNEGRDFKVPEGQTVTDDTFTAGVPEGQQETPASKSVMAGYKTDTEAASDRVAPMTKVGEAKVRGALKDMPDEKLIRYGKQGGVIGQVAEQMLAERGVYRDKLANNEVPTMTEEVEATGKVRAPYREQDMTPVDEDWGDRGSFGKAGTFAAGVVGTTGSSLAGAGHMLGLREVADLGDAMQRWSARKMPEKPTFADEVVQGFGSLGSFLIPGIGVAKGSQALAILAPTLAKWAGAGVMAGLEAAGEYDQTRKELIANGTNPVEAEEKAMGVFLANLALLGITDKVGFFNDLRVAYEKGGLQIAKDIGKKALVAKATESTQEGGQQVIQNLATDKNPGEGVGKAAAIGAIVGGGAAAVQNLVATPLTQKDQLATAMAEDEAGRGFSPADADRAARDAMNPNITEDSVLQPEQKGFAPPPRQQPTDATTPAIAADNDPLAGAPVTSPIADEIASLEGADPDPAIGGTPASQHNEQSLSVLANVHPDPVVREQAASALQQKQAESQDVDPELQDTVRRAIGDANATVVPETALPPAGSGGTAGLTRESAGVIRTLYGISGREPVWYDGNGAEGFVLARQHPTQVFLNARKGTITPLSVAGHEVFHLVETESPDLFGSFKAVVDRVSNIDLGNADGLLAYAQTYAPGVFNDAAIAELRKGGLTSDQIVDKLVGELGNGYTREMVANEFYNDLFGNRWSEPGFYKALIKEMARNDVGLLHKFKNALDLVVDKVKGMAGRNFEADKFIKDMEPVRQEAARVYAAYASRQSHRDRIGKMTPAELLLTKKSNPDEVVRDMAEAELKRREIDQAYKEKPAPETKKVEREKRQAHYDNEQKKQAATDEKVKLAEINTPEEEPSAMATALAKAKKDNQALRRQLAKEMKKAAATARGAAQARQDVLEDNEQGQFSPAREQTLPTRWPTAVGATPSVDDPMLADLETLRQTPAQFEQAVAALAEEPGLRSKARKTETKLSEILDKMVSNLLWLHDQVPAEIRARSKLWYDGAGVIATDWAKKYNKTRSQTAGILAVLSPQKDWFMNVTMGERVLDTLSTQMDHKFDAKMKGAAFKFLVKEWSKSPEKRDNMAAFEAAKGKTLREVIETGDLRATGVWMRAYDEAYHDPRHAVIHPEGDFGDNALTETGTETLRAWGDFSALGKAASIFIDGSLENINSKLGGEHKVRNFYNNIFAPKDARFTTVDTHAVAADLLRPLAGADKPVADNFGKSGGSNLTGVSGTYPIHFEAYKRAAEARGILPREMQSITWEAIRGLFKPGFKGKKENLVAVDKVWREVDAGRLSVAEARDKISEMAAGIEHPDWWNGKEPQITGNTKSYSQERPTFAGNKIVFEVAPDPHDTELTARWRALPEQAKAEISYDIAWDVAGRVLGRYNSDTIKGELHTQVGGYLDDTNPSFSLWMNKYASMVKVQEIANTLGYVLKQDSMVIGSPKKFKGGTEMGLIHIADVSDANAKAVYDELRAAIRNEQGEPLIEGHTTAEGSMAILVPLGTEEAIHLRAAEQLGDRHDVGYGSTFVQWPVKGENDYGFAGQDQDGRGGAEPSLREYVHQLRTETAAELERRIAGAKLSPARGIGSGSLRAPGYGTGQQGSVSLLGVHYSKAERNTLSGAHYGQGMKGAEKARLERESGTPGQRHRIHYYIDEGSGIRPESDVGDHAHATQLNNLYDWNDDPLNLWPAARARYKDPQDRFNYVEQQIMARGFDGVYAAGAQGNQGVAVVLGSKHKSVPVQYLGTGYRGGDKMGQTPAPKPKPKPLADRRDLPMGRMTGAEWKQVVPEATMLEDGKHYYKDDVSRALAPRLSPARDLFQKDFANKDTTISKEVVTSSRGTKETVKLGNVDSSGKKITNTVQGLENFWMWYGEGPVDDKGRPILMYHSTNADFSKFEPGRETTNNYGLLGDVTTSRAGIFASPSKTFSEEYLRSGEGGNVMPIYMALESPFDLRNGVSAEMERELSGAGVSTRYILTAPSYWELFDNDEDGNNAFVSALKTLGYDGAIIWEDDQNGKPQETYIAFRPEQIKSAIGNVGTFDATDPDIRRSPARDDQWRAVRAMWLEAAQNEDLFQFPKTDAETLAGVFKDIDPGIRVTQKGVMGDMANRGVKERYVVYMPGGKDAEVYIKGDGRMWVNASQLQAGRSAGVKLYAGLLAFAHNTNRKLVGDPLGVSDLATFRRTENMLSAALKYGTTDFMEPSHTQQSPAMYKDVIGHKPEVIGKFAPLRWTDGDDTGNLDQLLRVSYTNVKTLVPEIENVIYNTRTRAFEWADSARPVTEGEWQVLSGHLMDRLHGRGTAGSAGGRQTGDAGTPAGGATLKRAALTGTVLRETSGEGARSVLDSVSQQLREHGLGPLEGVAYSPSRFYSQLQRQIEQAPDRVFGPASQVKAWLASNAGKLGIKQDEVQWSGINEWLDLQGKARVSKEDIVEYLQQNGVRIEEVEKKDFGFDEDNPSLPPGQGLEVIPFDQLSEEQVADLEARGNRNDYAVVNADGEAIGLGSTEDEAVFDAYSGYPEYWKTGTKYGEYTLPGSTNYRELLLTLPTKAPLSKRYVVEGQGPGATLRDTKTGFRITQGNYGRMTEMAMVKNAEDAGQAKPFKSGHWEEANILAHVRFNDRTDADGAKVLFIEELQSDWAQRGREEGFGAHGEPKSKRPNQGERDALLRDIRQAAAEEFVRRGKGILDEETAHRIANTQPISFVAQTAGREAEWNDLLQREQEWDRYDRKKPVPTGPFVGKTEAWLDLALKRMVAYAVENGYDKVAFVNGEQSADRYDLSKKIASIEYKANDDGTYHVTAKAVTGGVALNDNLTAAELESTVGKDLASKITNNEGKEFPKGSVQAGYRKLIGLDLKVGGEGMIAFYDKIVPQRMREVLKKVGGGKVETVLVTEDGAINVGMSDAVGEQLGFAITPEIRERVAEGLPLFSPARFIDNTIARLDAAVDGLSHLPDQFDYLKDRYLALGKIARVDEIIDEIRKGFQGLPQADKAAVYSYLTTRGASLNIIGDPDARAMAKRVKDTINYVGDALVARGLLDPAARAHYKDQYLPRMYLKHLMKEDDWKVLGSGKKPSDMGYLKGRKDIAPEIRELVLGEVKDPAFLSASAIGRAMRDVALLDWLGKISQNGNWIYPQVFVNYRGQRVSAYWLSAEARRITGQIPHYTPANQVRAQQLVDQMRQLADQALAQVPQVVNGTVEIDHTKYKQIPDVHRYGLLRGMLVREEIYNDVMGDSQLVNADPSFFEDWLGYGGKGTKLVQWWKFSKVALNPPGQIRNFISNMVMLQLSGIGLHKLPVRLLQAAREITSNGPHWKVAKKFGVTESTFTAQELHRVKRDLLALEAKTAGMNPLTWLRYAGAHFLDKVADLYQFSEALGKTIKIIDEMAKGKSEAEAAIEAQKWLFDYSLVPKSVRYLRNAPVGSPFITYQVKVLPRLLEVAMKYPWRFLPWAGLIYGMQSYVASLFGADDDELKKLKKSLPQWLQDRSHTVFLPVRDAEGRLQVADVGYFFPWTFFTQIGMHLGEGNLRKALVDDLGGMLSAPVLGAAAAVLANHDTFTKKPIYEESDPVGYQAAALANFAYDLMAPPFISSHGFASPMGLVDKKYGGKMVQAVTGTTNKFGDPKATEMQAIAGLLGLNFYGMDPEHTRATNLMVMAGKVKDAEKQLKYRLMDRGLSDEQRAKHMQDYQARMTELAEEASKYTEESEVPESLRVRK